MKIDIREAWKNSQNKDFNNQPITPAKNVVKKQVSISWFIVLAVVFIPVFVVIGSLSWYAFWRTDVAYIQPESVVIRANDDMFIHSIKHVGDKVNVNDTIAHVYLSGFAKWIDETSQIAKMSQTITSQKYVPLNEYQNVINLCIAKESEMTIRYKNLKNDKSGYVTPKEVFDAYQDLQESKVALHKAMIDLDVARIQNKATVQRIDIDNEMNKLKPSLNTAILSPITGQVVKSLVNANEQVIKGQEMLHIAGIDNFFIDMHLKASDVVKRPIGTTCYVWFPNGSKITAHITNYVSADSLGTIIARMKPDSKIDDVFMIPGLPVNTRCK